jgi:integrase
MRLSEHAAEYVRANGLRARVIVSNCQRFERLTGISEPDRISEALLVAFRQAAIAMAFSHVTIEKTVTDVCTILRSVVGKIPEIGKRLRRPRPEPKPVPLSDIDAIFAAASSQRLRRWLAIAYWTGLRLSDSIEVYVTCNAACDVLRHRASKTGLNHCWPVPEWLKEWLPRVEPHTGYSTPWFGELIRHELSETCERASVRHATPKQIRQASITEWTRANATAGAIVHGSGLGAMAHYLDPLSVLESAAPRVRLPSCFGSAHADTESTLLTHFRRLDPAAQSLITGTAERLAAG